MPVTIHLIRLKYIAGIAYMVLARQTKSSFQEAERAMYCASPCVLDGKGQVAKGAG